MLTSLMLNGKIYEKVETEEAESTDSISLSPCSVWNTTVLSIRLQHWHLHVIAYYRTVPAWKPNPGEESF